MAQCAALIAPYTGCPIGSCGVGEFVDAIEHYVTVHNKDPMPFVWTAKANDILQKVIRANSRAARVGRNKRSALRRMGVDRTGIAGSRRITLR